MRSLRWSLSIVHSIAVFAAVALAFAPVVAAQEQPAPTSEKPASTPEPAVKPAPKMHTQPAAGRADSPGAEADTTMRLGVGDLLEVSVYNVPELTSKARVSNNGDIYLPLVSYVHVEGLTTDEAQGVIEKKLSDGGFVKGPHVTVFVDQYASQGASVLGEVARPGVYPILGQVRLFDLISAAGGLTDKAGNSVSITHRSQPDKPFDVTLARNLGDSPQANTDIAAGDTIVVRRADIVYVVGDVGRPSGLLIDRGNLTVLQAIAMAGGTTRTSKLNGTRILHKGPEGISEKHVELKKILEAKIPDVPLSPDDILFVPSSSLKLALQDNMSIAMQAASLGIVAVH
jgi:polysaccharide export outer membrane protein